MISIEKMRTVADTLGSFLFCCLLAMSKNWAQTLIEKWGIINASLLLYSDHGYALSKFSFDNHPVNYIATIISEE